MYLLNFSAGIYPHGTYTHASRGSGLESGQGTKQDLPQQTTRLCASIGKEKRMEKTLAQYWRKNLFYMVILLSIWTAVSYGCGILFVEQLNTIKIAGFPLGFWFAQQGAMYVFVVLIFAYFVLMEKLDKEYDVHE